jgi:O-antigen/teichoic acid export membrane protein
MISRIRHILATRHNVRAHFWQSLANYAQQGGAVVLGIFLARLLTPDDFGAIAYAAALIGLFCIPLDWTAAQVLVADRGKTPELFAEVMSLGFVVMGAKSVVTIGVVAWQWITGNHLTAILVGMAGPGLVAGTAAWIYRSAAEGSGHFKANFHVQAITLSLSFLVGVGLAWAGAGVYALAFMGLATVFPPFFIYPRYVHHKFYWRLNRHVIKNLGVDGFWMWLNGISSATLTRVDRLFLGSAVDDAGLGNYTRAFNYANMSSWALNSFITNPAVVSLSSAESVVKRRKILLTNSGILGAGATFSFIIFGVFADPVVPFVFGEQWRSAIPTFQAFSPINFFAAFLYLPITLLLSQKRFCPVAIAQFAGLLFLASISWWMGKQLNGPFMAIILQGSLLLAGVICWIAAIPLLQSEKPCKNSTIF